MQVALPDPSVVERRSGLRLERLDELVKLGVVEIGDGPERHLVAGPVPHVEAAEGARVGQRFAQWISSGHFSCLIPFALGARLPP